MPFLPRNADVVEGDLLITSGLGGTFPPGYPVGVVTRVTSDAGQPFLKIIAEPAAALNRVREVLLIWPEPIEGDDSPTDQDTEIDTEFEAAAATEDATPE